MNCEGVPAPPVLPGTGNGSAAFSAPWQARAFALAVALNEAGHLDWPGWTQLLGEELAMQGLEPAAPSPDDALYYRCWIAALEKACAGMSSATPSGRDDGQSPAGRLQE